MSKRQGTPKIKNNDTDNQMKTRPFLVGLTGASGSGKTTFLRHLSDAFSSEQLCIISQDNYYRSREDQVIDEHGVRNFDLPESINREEFFRDIQKLLSGESVLRQEYTFNNPLVTPKILTFEPRPIIILEGIFILHYAEIAELLDLKVFLHAKDTTALSRRIRRDQLERNYPLEDVLYRYEHHVLPTYERYIKPFRDQADIIINNNSRFERGLKVLIGFLKQRMNSTDL